MPMQFTKDTLFIPKPSRAGTKNDITTQVARAIIDAETAARQAKSQRLKELRLEKKAAEARNKLASPQRTISKRSARRKSTQTG